MIWLTVALVRHDFRLLFVRGTDIIDPDICSPEVLYLFTDEFDWEDLRQQFVK